MISTKESVRTCYAAALERCLDAFRQLDDEDWQCRPPRRQWSARDYLAHLTTNQEREMNPVTSASVAGEAVEVPGLGSRTDIDEFNASCVEAVRDLTPQELLTRFQAAFQAHIDMLEGLSKEDLQRPGYNPGLSRPGTIADLFSIGFLHLPLHYQDIRRIIRGRKSLPHWMEVTPPEEVHEALSQAFAVMPLFYWPERGGDLRATYLFDLEGEGSGQWTVEIAAGQCSSYEGLPPHADCRFRTKPAYWLDLQTKDVNPLWAIISRRLRLKGLGLALRLEKLFQIT
ncbi:MAG: DinB family protein [Chloroflexota bacterium]|nr:DinB family protein [Chloroflexota bacterium]